MDRRTFVKTGASLAAARCMPPPLAAALERPATLALADTALRAGRAFAEAAAARATPLVEVGEDVGALWHATLAPHLARKDAALIGVIRASDFFVLRQLAARAGCRAAQTTTQAGGGGPAVVTFVIERRPLANQKR